MVTVECALLDCAPVGVQSDPHGSVGRFSGVVRNTIDHLVCYEIRGRDERREVLVNNEFGQQPLTVRKPQLLCVPSLQTPSLETPRDRDDDRDRHDDKQRRDR